MTMKKMISLGLAACMAFALAAPAGAVAEETNAQEKMDTIPAEEMLLNDEDFMSNATVTKVETADETYEFELMAEEVTPIAGSDGEVIVTQQAAKIVAFGEEEAEAVEALLVSKGETLYTPTKENTYFGGTLYMQSFIKYATLTRSGVTYYKMTALDTKATVRDGTTLKKREVQFVMTATIPGGTHQNKYQTVAVTKGTDGVYRALAPSAWVECAPTQAGDKLGGDYRCTVARPSGTDTVYTLQNYVFKK